MRTAELLGLLALIAAAVAGTTAAAQDVGDARKGLAFAQQFCTERHGVAPGQLVPAAAPPFSAIRQYARNDSPRLDRVSPHDHKPRAVST
jgi:hypothetical protein